MLWNGRLKLGAGGWGNLVTSMDCDGTKDGYDLDLTKTIAEQVSVPVIASEELEPWNIFMKL